MHGRSTALRRLILMSFATTMALGLGGAVVAAPAPHPDTAVSGELRVVSNWTGAEGDAFQAVIDAFGEQFPDVTVTIEQVPFDQTQALLTQQFAAGTPPDVSVALPGIIRLLSEQDLLLDIGDLWDEWVANGDYTDSLRAIASGPDGTAYGVYFKGNVNGLIWYSPPATRGARDRRSRDVGRLHRRDGHRQRGGRRPTRRGRRRRVAAHAVERPDHLARRWRRGVQRPRPRRDRLGRPWHRRGVRGLRRAGDHLLPRGRAGDRLHRRHVRPRRQATPCSRTRERSST